MFSPHTRLQMYSQIRRYLIMYKNIYILKNCFFLVKLHFLCYEKYMGKLMIPVMTLAMRYQQNICVMIRPQFCVREACGSLSSRVLVRWICESEKSFTYPALNNKKCEILYDRRNAYYTSCAIFYIIK